MSKDHEGDVRQYIHLKRAWYAEANLRNIEYVDCVTFGFYSPDGGTSGERACSGINWKATQTHLPVFAASPMHGMPWHSAKTCLMR